MSREMGNPLGLLRRAVGASSGLPLRPVTQQVAVWRESVPRGRGGARLVAVLRGHIGESPAC